MTAGSNVWIKDTNNKWREGQVRNPNVGIIDFITLCADCSGALPDYYEVQNCNNSSETYLVNTPSTFLSTGKTYTLTSTDNPTLFDGVACWLVTSIVHTGTPDYNVSFNDEYDDCALCSIASFNSYTGTTKSVACSSSTLTTIYYRGNLTSGTTLYTSANIQIGINEVPDGYYVNADLGNGQTYRVNETDLVYNNAGQISEISYCPAPTPTPTPTQTPVTVGGFITVTYGANTNVGLTSACNSSYTIDLYYKLGDPNQLTDQQVYYTQYGFLFDGTSQPAYSDGNLYGPINASGKFISSGHC